MDGIQLIASLVSGGLAGGCVSTVANRVFHWRALRTKFYPPLNDFLAAYLIRMENPQSRYWISKVGYLPSKDDEKFVDHRAIFISRLVEFNELSEARELRRKLLTIPNDGGGLDGDIIRTDLMPEYEAVSDCLKTVYKKLKL